MSPRAEQVGAGPYDGAVTAPSSEPTGFKPSTPAGERAFIVTPFARLARAHTASAMADAMVAASFAGSLFFSVPAGDARAPVLRYLIITMLPFAVLSPLIGPAIDRIKGGHRVVLITSMLARAGLCYLLIEEIGVEGPVFFLLALLVLVSQKAYQVGRSALVPTVVRSDGELVEANSKLSLLSGLASGMGAIPAWPVLTYFGPEWSIGMAMVTYATAAAFASRIPPARVAKESADVTEKVELRGATIIMAGSAMASLRACVGFLTLLIAFDIRTSDRQPWELAVIGGATVISQLSGAAIAPRIRAMTTEENLLSGAVGLVVLGAITALLMGDVTGAAILGASVGFGAAAGKLAFDSILQRDAPDANRGRAFARFETRFQVAWVFGALAPVAIDMNLRLGFVVVLVIGGIAAILYTIGRLAYAHRSGARQNATTARAVGIEDRIQGVSGEVKGRLSRVPRAAMLRFRTRSGRRVGQVPPPGEGGEGAVVFDQFGEVVEGPYVEYLDDEEDFDLGDDPDSWPQPQWGSEIHPVGGSAPPLPETDPTAVADPTGLAQESPLAWDPEASTSPYPWQPSPEQPTRRGEFLEDVDPSVHNPFPWSPDDEDD